jgi:lipopolysaccharide export system ATP-binding protein
MAAAFEVASARRDGRIASQPAQRSGRKLRGLRLTKRYSGRAVADRIELSIDGGQVVGLLGPNGAGKTTTFYMLAGLVRPDKGRVLLDGNDITYLPLYGRARQGLSYLPQEPSVFRKLSVGQNLPAVLETLPLTPADRRHRLDGLLNELAIAHLARRPAGVLSGDGRRRVEIRRALVLNPAFFCLDEPVAGIDPITVVEIGRIIRYLKERNIGILISDHNVHETLSVIDRVVIIHGGSP